MTAPQNLRFDATSPARRLAQPVSYILVFFSFTLLVIPTEAVIPGPLKGNGSPARLAALVMAALILVGFAWAKRDSSKSRKINAGAVIILVYATAQILIYSRSFTSLLSPVQEAAATRSLVSTLQVVGLVLFTMRFARSERSRDAVLLALVIGAAYAAVIGLIQGISGDDFRYFLVPPGFDFLTGKGLAERDGFTRVIGTSGHPIEFSVVVVTVLPIALHYSRYASSSWGKVAAGLSTAALFVAVPASVSRTAIVAIAAALLIYMLALPVRLIFTSVALLGVVIAFYYVAVPELFQALVKLFSGADSDDSITGRTDDYAYVSEIFKLNPIMGRGPGSTLPENTRYLDNQWLQALITGGLVGFSALAVFIVGGFAGATAALRSSPSKKDRDLIYALIGSFVSMAISTSFFDLFAFSQSMLLFFFYFALLWTFVRRDGFKEKVADG